MKDPGIASLGERIRAICAQHGGVTETAKVLGIERQRLQNWCQGKCEPSAWFLRRLAHLGDVTVDWLLSDAQDGAQEMAWADARKGIGAFLRFIHEERRFLPPRP